MKRWQAIAVLAAALGGCGGGDDPDDVAEDKKPLPLNEVPGVVMAAAKKAAPELTFFAAYQGKYNGRDSIELMGKSPRGKIKEVEVAPTGEVLAIE